MPLQGRLFPKDSQSRTVYELVRHSINCFACIRFKNNFLYRKVPRAGNFPPYTYLPVADYCSLPESCIRLILLLIIDQEDQEKKIIVFHPPPSTNSSQFLNTRALEKKLICFYKIIKLILKRRKHTHTQSVFSFLVRVYKRESTLFRMR